MKRKVLREDELQWKYVLDLKEDAEAEQETGMPLFHGSVPNKTTDRVTNSELMSMLARRARHAPAPPQFGVLKRDLLK
jgi:hypothetical protein